LFNKFFIFSNVKAKHFSSEIYNVIMDIPTATSFNELQKIFNVLKKSDEPKIHGNLLNLI